MPIHGLLIQVTIHNFNLTFKEEGHIMKESCAFWLRVIVIAISVAMFCFQLNIAIQSLIFPQEVDSTSIIDIKDINDIELPIITLCPTNQTNITALQELGYYDEQNLLMGYVGDKISWGGYHNLTHEELLQLTHEKWFTKFDVVFGNGYQSKARLKYLPPYGFCEEISECYPGSDISLSLKNTDIRIFITDNNYRSYFNLDFTSQKGDPIINSRDEIHYYDVEVDVTSWCNVKPDLVPEKDSFKQCVDEELLRVIGKPLGCLPPWMSPNNQCNSTYPSTFWDSIPDFWVKYINIPMTLRNMEIERKCRKYCSMTRSTVQLREKRPASGMYYNPSQSPMELPTSMMN